MLAQTEFGHITTALGPKISYNGINYLYFGGTAYLGIPQHKGFLKLYLEGLRNYGLNNGTSRSNNVQLGIYNEVEAYAAVKYGAAAALITSSGFLAAQFAVKHLAAFGETIYAPITHPALWLTEPSVTGDSFKQWTEEVVTKINTGKAKNGC